MRHIHESTRNRCNTPVGTVAVATGDGNSQSNRANHYDGWPLLPPGCGGTSLCGCSEGYRAGVTEWNDVITETEWRFLDRVACVACRPVHVHPNQDLEALRYSLLAQPTGRLRRVVTARPETRSRDRIHDRRRDGQPDTDDHRHQLGRPDRLCHKRHNILADPVCHRPRHIVEVTSRRQARAISSPK